MKLILSIIMIATILFTGCSDKPEGQVRIYSDIENATIYIDGNKKGITSYGYTSVALADGKHEVRIYKEINEEWYYEGKQSIYVGKKTPDNFKIYTDKKPTKLRLERLAGEALLAKEDLVSEGKKANAAAAATLERARASDEYSMKLMVDYYESGYGVKIDTQKAEFWKKKVNLLSKEKQEEADRLAKDKQEEEDRLAKDKQANASAALKRARASDVYSMKLMVDYYESGYGVEINRKKAEYWKKKVNLFSKDKQKKAAATLEKARAGNVDSMRLMAEYYESGYGVMTNSNKAKYWQKKANIFSKEKQDEAEKLAREKRDEAERLAKEKMKEEERLVWEKMDEEERLLWEKIYEEQRPAREKAQRLKIAKEYGFSSYPVDTYIDTETKQMWQDNEDAKSVHKDWSGATEYCQDLSIGEYSDWKLPSYLELLSIFTYQKDHYAIKGSFKNAAFMKYWSSSENSNGYAFAWYVDFSKGDAIISGKSNRYNVRCVRGGAASQAFKISY